MRRALAALALGAMCACSGESSSPAGVDVPGRPGATKSSATVRAQRRLFDGAPPTVPHPPLGGSCTQCHNARGMDVPGLGFAPPSPHEDTPGMSALSRCNQCHVHVLDTAEFVANGFAGVRQDLRKGERLYDGAPPVMPHSRSMRENCAACHDGPAAREEVRCTHPERTRCDQCHVPSVDDSLFTRP